MRLTVISSGSAGNCYVLQGSGSALVLECGAKPETAFVRTGLVPSQVAACLVSHEHGDHAAYAGRWASFGIPVAATAGTLEALSLDGRPGSRVLGRMSVTRIGDWTIRAFDVVHDAADPAGFVIEHPDCGRILFVTDSRKVPYTFRSLKLDHIMVEANYSDDIVDGRVEEGSLDIARAARVRQTHMSLRTACEVVRANVTASLKTVILIHLSQWNSDPEYFVRKAAEVAPFAKVYVAAAGLTVELKKCEI